MDLGFHQKKIDRITQSNKKFKHMAYIPNLKELEEFYTISSDFFSIEAEPVFLERNIFFSVKDIFNTYTFPTEMGSSIWKGFKAGNNARVISMVLNSGFNFLGKTQTSEFAVHASTPTINPWDQDRIVGTSSSGSAISVLLNESDISLATQSGASISRPASYCGVVGFKPTFGLIPRTGILKTCDPFDTVGFFSQSYEKSISALNAMSLVGNNYPQNSLKHDNQKHIKVGFFKQEDLLDLVEVSKTMLNAYNAFIETLTSQGIEVIPIKPPSYFKKVHQSHHVIYTKSLEYYFKNELRETKKITESFSKFINSSESLTKEDFINELENHSERIIDFTSYVKKLGVDFIATPAVFGEAPMAEEEEKDDMSLIWTYLHVPCLTIPFSLSEELKLPLGINLASIKGRDIDLLKFAQTYIEEKKHSFV